MKNKKRLYLLLSLLWLGFILGQSVMPAKASHMESAAVLEPVQQLSSEITHTSLRSLAHFFFFAIWGFLLYRLFRQYEHFNLLKPISVALCGAFADETIQLFSPGRFPEVADMWIDLAGASCLILATHFFTVIRRKKHSSKEAMQ